jgi:fatty acid desaturase
LRFDAWVTHPQVHIMASPGDAIGSQHFVVAAPVSRAALTTAPNELDVATSCVVFAIYAGYLLLTWFFRDLPLWVAAPLGAVWLTWHGSLQHETIHGHPTPSRRLNAALAGPPLSLWIPYRLYRATHLRHHRHGGRHLTDVWRDPESFFVPPGTLSRMGFLRRAVHFANCTLAGRLTVGPAVMVARFWAGEVKKALAGDRACRVVWTRHAIAVSLVLLWTDGVCHIPVAIYVLCVVYPSISLNLLRSFAEHRADPEPPLRTTAVEAHALWGLLFLNNNLHIAHHAHPALPWHQLPRMWRQMRAAAVGSGVVLHRGYREVAARYLFRPVISIEHPGTDGAWGTDGASPR